MTRYYLILVFFFFTLGAFAQNKTVKGIVLDKDSHAALAGAEVKAEGEDVTAYTDKDGRFNLEIPKGSRRLLVSKAHYNPFRYRLKPGFHWGSQRIYLEAYKPVNPSAKRRLENDSLFLTYKNAVSISVLEFFCVGLGLRYERFLATKHAIGLHATYYFNGISTTYYTDFSGYMSRANYTGFKAAPFYRYYPYRNEKMGFFMEAKIPFGYFDFSKITYRYRTTTHLTASISPTFWTWGGGISLGLLSRLPGSKHGMMNFSLGWQYFPMADVPEYIPRQVSGGSYIELEGSAGWWYFPGPGSYLEVKLTFGGIF